ncbi:MAG TPA: serine/threonine protein phosphatase [Ruminococcaceae bacterium]|nr:serine/threonine protein phosphatase [Oscillospiraceae bacterium]
MLFTISDLHLSLGSNKPMDIFSGWENHVERLEQNWRKIISENDTVIIPGDISWGLKLEETKEDFLFLENLPGHKYILKGNHDLWWSTVKKMTGYFDELGIKTIEIVHNNAFVAENASICGTRGWYYDDTESDRKVLLREAGRLERSILEAEKTGLPPVVFLHYPPLFGENICPEIYEILVNHKVKRCYYGHLHGASFAGAFNGEKDGIKFRLVSGDYLSFCPYRIIV